MKAILIVLLSLSFASFGFGDEPHIIRILQFYHKSDGDLRAVNSWIDLNEGGRILQKFYHSTERTNSENPSLEQFKLFQIEEYRGNKHRFWDLPLRNSPPPLRESTHRPSVESTLRRSCLANAYLGGVIEYHKKRPTLGWDRRSLREMKEFLEGVGRHAAHGKWTDQNGFSVALQVNGNGVIEWMTHYQDGRLVFSGLVFEVDEFPPILDNE